MTKAGAKGRLWTREFLTGSLINLGIVIGYYMLMVVMVAYATDAYAAAPSIAAFCSSIFVVGILASRPVAPPVMDAVGPRRLLVIAMALLFASCLVYLAGGGIELLLAIRFAHGFIYGFGSTIITAIVTSGVPRDRQGEGVGYFMLSITLGAAVGPLLGTLLANVLGVDPVFGASAIVTAFAFVASLTLPRAGQRASRQVEEELAEEMDEVSSEPLEGAATFDEAPARGLRRVFEPRVIPWGIVCFNVYLAYSFVLTFLNPFAQAEGLEDGAMFFFVVYALAMLVTRPFTGRAFDRRGIVPVAIPSFIAFVAGMALFGMSVNSAMLLLSAVLLGFGVGTLQSSLLAKAIEKVPIERIGVANATFLAFADLSVGLGPVTLGLLVPLWGYRYISLALAVVGFFAALLFSIVLAHSRKGR